MKSRLDTSCPWLDVMSHICQPVMTHNGFPRGKWNLDFQHPLKMINDNRMWLSSFRLMVPKVRIDYECLCLQKICHHKKGCMMRSIYIRRTGFLHFWWMKGVAAADCYSSNGYWLLRNYNEVIGDCIMQILGSVRKMYICGLLYVNMCAMLQIRLFEYV